MKALTVIKQGVLGTWVFSESLNQTSKFDIAIAKACKAINKLDEYPRSRGVYIAIECEDGNIIDEDEIKAYYAKQ